MTAGAAARTRAAEAAPRARAPAPPEQLLRPRGAAPQQIGAPVAGRGDYTGKADVECEMLVLGSGSGRLQRGVPQPPISDEDGASSSVTRSLGGVCLNVGCIPSKALLHIAAVMDEAEVLAEHGIAFGRAEASTSTNLRCAWKNKVVGKLTGRSGAVWRRRGQVEVVRGFGSVPRSASSRSS